MENVRLTNELVKRNDYASFLEDENKTVNDIMTTTPKMVTPKTKISEIQRIMHKYKVHTVLVVDKDNHLKGIVDHYACMV